MAEARAVARYVRVPPRKARLVIDLIRGRNINEALTGIRFTKKHAARIIEKVLRSALANAQRNHGVRNVDRLFVREAFVDQGPMLKRFQPRAMGRVNMIRHRTSHITVVLAEH